MGEKAGRSPLSVIRENKEKEELLGSFLETDLIIFHEEDVANDMYKQVKEVVEKTWNTSVSSGEQEPLPQIGGLELPDARYTLGNNACFIAPILSLLRIVGYLKRRTSSYGEGETTVALKSSYMHKRGGKMKNWRRRWFSLTGKSIHYYVNENKNTHKGSIPLRQAQVHQTGGGVTAYSFIIATPQRDFFLSCENEEDREEWMAAVAKAQSRTSTRDANTSSNQIKQQIAQLEQTYQAFGRSDPHTHWILQWWVPMFLEVLTRFHACRDGEHYRSLSKFLKEKTTMALYLLTGDQLYDRKFVRAFEGLVRSTHESGKAKDFLAARLRRMQDILVQGTEYSAGVTVPSVVEFHTLWKLQSSIDRLLITPQVKNSHKLPVKVCFLVRRDHQDLPFRLDYRTPQD